MVKLAAELQIGRPVGGTFRTGNGEVPDPVVASKAVLVSAEQQDVVPGAAHVGIVGPRARDVAFPPVALGLPVDHQSPLLGTTDRELGREPRGQTVEPGRGLNVQVLEQLRPELGLASHEAPESSDGMAEVKKVRQAQVLGYLQKS